MPGPLGEGLHFYERPPGSDLAGGLVQEKVVKRRSGGSRFGVGPNGVVKLISGGDIEIADPGLFPGAPTMKRKLTRGLHGLSELGSAAILTTNRGVQAVGGHFINVVNTLDPEAVTTPTWMAAPFIFSRIQGDPRLPVGETAETVARRGVQIVSGVLKKTDSDATMLLSVRPTGDSVTGFGTLSEKEIKEMFAQQLPWLVEEAKKASRRFVVFLEAEPTLIGAKGFAEVARELNVPHAVSVRPNDKGEMPDGSSYGKVAQAIDSDLLVFAGVNCQGIGPTLEALRLASGQGGAEIFTLYVAPNGADDYSETHGELTAQQSDQIRADNIRGLIRIREEYGTPGYAGCCNSTVDDLAVWGEKLRSSETVFQPRVAGPTEPLVVYGRAGAI